MSATVTVIGNCTRDPELRFTPSGAAVAKFGVAVNKRVKQNGEWVDGDPSFFDVTCWNGLAENVSESVTKGTRLVIVGRLEQRNWDDKESGQKRYAVEIVADEVAPSLRWATASVSKVERSNGGGAAPSRGDSFGEEPF